MAQPAEQTPHQYYSHSSSPTVPHLNTCPGPVDFTYTTHPSSSVAVPTFYDPSLMPGPSISALDDG